MNRFRIVVKGPLGQAMDEALWYGASRVLQGHYHPMQHSAELIAEIDTASLERWFRANSHGTAGALIYYAAVV